MASFDRRYKLETGKVNEGVSAPPPPRGWGPATSPPVTEIKRLRAKQSHPYTTGLLLFHVEVAESLQVRMSLCTALGTPGSPVA